MKKSVNIGFPVWTIGLIFLVLKLTNTISWPWIWVLCPFWIGPAIALVILLFVGIICLLGLFGR